VKNFGEKFDPSRWRAYISGDQLGFHTDTADVVPIVSVSVSFYDPEAEEVPESNIV